MTRDRPPTYDELVARNRELTADNDRLREAVGSLQSTMVRLDAELARARRPRREPLKLSDGATDAFARPFRG